MANRLRMALIETIITLRRRGWSRRRIARELGVDRETVTRHLREAAEASNATIAPPGSEPVEAESNATIAPLGSPGPEDGADAAPTPVGDGGSVQRMRTVPGGDRRGLGAGPVGPADLPGPGRRARLHRQLLQRPPVRPSVGPAVGVAGPPDGVRGRRRGAGGLRPRGADRHARRPAAADARLPGRAQSFAQGLQRGGHAADDRGVHPRLENAFAHFGGVPRRVVLDNLKAAVKQADWFDPELNPKVQEFARHYGTIFWPTKPYTPRHKGKVERGVGYVKNNALKGRTFASLDEQNRFLQEWERTVADTRIHGTTRRQVGPYFAAVEKPALAPLPPARFPCFQEGRRVVNRDGHIEIGRAYYSAPPEYLARRVWVRWDGRLVRLFNDRLEQIAVHVQREPGRFSTQPKHIVAEKISGVERGAAWILGRIRRVGPHCTRWAEACVQARGVEGVRVLQGLLSLTHRHSVDRHRTRLRDRPILRRLPVADRPPADRPGRADADARLLRRRPDHPPADRLRPLRP